MSDDRPPADGPADPDAPSEGPFRSSFGSDEPPSMAVVRCVAAITDVEPTSMGVLQHAVDADALDDLVGDGGGAVEVEFRYRGHLVTVANDGTITIRGRPGGE